MTKKLFKTLVIIAFFALISAIFWLISVKRLAQENKGEFPHFVKPVNSNISKSILIYFDTKCGHCRELFQDIEIVDSTDVMLYLLTIEDVNQIKDEVELLKLDCLNCNIQEVDPVVFYQSFGSLKTPQAFLYDRNLNFVGELDANKSVNSLLSQANSY